MAAQPEYRNLEHPPAPKWRRILETEEFFADKYDTKDWSQWMEHAHDHPGLTYGYWCEAGVLLKGHETCRCDRAQSVQIVELFCAHPPNYQFPLHYEVMTKLVDHVCDDGQFGWNDYSIGALVRQPTYALYGFLLQTNRWDASYNDDW